MKQTKRILSLLLSLCLVLGLIPGTAFAAGGNLPFTDVDTTDWCYDAVQYVYEKSMMNGTSTTTFSPDSTTTRGMIVTILHRMEGTPAATGTAFTDVPTSQWYSDAVSWASANGIVGGYGNGLFGPSDPITREQMAAILNRYSTYKDYDAGTTGSITGFSDASQVNSYAVEPMGWAIGNGLISGVGNNTLAPKGNATRAQVATILMRFCKNIADKANNTPEMPIDKTYTVTFDLNYGSDTRYDAKTVKEGETVSKPSNPTRSGYSFSGWYAEKSGGKQFDFKTGITKDLTLYAHWTSNSSGGSSSGGSSSGGSTTPVVYYYTVSFDVLASDVSNIPPAQQIRSGGLVTEPVAPSRSGYNFTGWYIDNAYTDKYDFKTPIAGNITLYAKWSPVGSPAPGPGGDTDGVHRVTFDLNDGSSGVYEIQVVEDGKKANNPSSEPERRLYRFTGWYEEPSGAVAYDFDSVVTDDLTLYAGWGNPNENGDGLYSANDTEETVYSVSGLTVNDNEVTATININSTSVLLVEFFEDTLGAGEEWTKVAMETLLSKDPILSIATYTPAYGELISVSIPMEDHRLPTYYFARVRLLSSEGEDLCDPFLYIEGSKKYAEFEKKTIDDYDQDKVINFDESKTTNFGVLNKDTKEIAISETTNKLTVKDIDVADRLVPNHTYTFASPDSTVQGLQQGDIVYIKDTQYLFKVDSVITNADGSITVEPDNNAGLEDFYSTLKVDMAATSDEDIQPMSIEDIHKEGTLSLELTFPSIQFNLARGINVKGEASVKESLDIKIIYDLKIFGKDYFEMSLTSKTTTEFSAAIEITPENDEGKNPLKKDLLGGKGKVPFPTPIPGLEGYTKVALPLELTLTAGVSATWTSTQKSGFSYNTYTGRNDIKDTEKSLELKAEGKAELKVGPQVAIGIQVVGEIVSAEINASAGAKISAAIAVTNDDALNNTPSKHSCILCISGAAKWYAEVHIKAEYDIKVIEGTIIDAKLIGLEGPIPFPGSREGKFYIAIIPGPDSVFSKKSSQDPEWILGGGECPNTAYRTELKTADENEAELTNIPVRIKKNTGTFDKTGNSAYVVYLHDGTYTASTSIAGKDISKSVIVKGAQQTVTLSPNSGNKNLTGKIVESTNINQGVENATVKVSKDGLVIATVSSSGSGDFSISLPEGQYLVEVTKSGYIPFSIYQQVENDQASTQMKTIELIQGSGMGGFRGIITDAVTGDPIEGVQLDLRSGWGNSSHGDVRKTLRTDSNGEFRYNTTTLPFVNTVLGLECGNYTLTAKKDGYIGTSFNIIVLPGETDSNPQQDATMAPAQTEGDTWRIVLTWGENPRDLDSHVVGALTSGNSFHVYYSHKSQYDGSLEVCNLDRDDTTSYGPETITLNTNSSTPYYYYIYRYAGSGTVASSGAQIKVYHGADSVRTFNVPTGLGDGDYWNVFAVVDGRIVVQNTITDNADVTYAGAAGIMTIDLNEMEDKANVPSTDEDFTGTVSGEDVSPEITFVLADAQADARAVVNEYEMEKVTALTGQAAIDAATAKITAETTIDEATDQVEIDAAVDAYKVAIDALIASYEHPEIDDTQTSEQELDRNGSETTIPDEMGVEKITSHVA